MSRKSYSRPAISVAIGEQI